MRSIEAITSIAIIIHVTTQDTGTGMPPKIGILMSGVAAVISVAISVAGIPEVESEHETKEEQEV